MIKIRKIDCTELKNKLADENCIKYEESYDFLGVFDGDTVLEFAVYDIQNTVLDIKFISNINNDFSLIHGLLKTIMFISDLKKLEAVVLPKSYKRAAKALRFKETDNNYILRLDDYQNTCNCTKET